MLEFLIKNFPYLTWIVTAICWWKIFSKANVAGWKALIPFYADYTRYKIAGKTKLYWWYLLITAAEQVYAIISKIVLAGNVMEFFLEGTFRAAGIEMKMVKWGLIILIAVFDAYIGRELARKFGKSDIFGFGIGLIPILFVPILAFGKDEFQEKVQEKEYI